MAVRWWSKLVGSRTRGPETEPAPEPRPGEAVVEPAEAPASPPTPDAAPTHSRWADEDVTPAGDEAQPSSPPEATRESLQRSLRWRARVLLEKMAGVGRLGHGPAIVKSLQDDNESIIRQPPTAARRALTVTRNPDSGLDEVVRIIEQSPSMAQALLKTANSSWYRGGGENVVSINEAVMRVGTQGVENVLLASMVEGLLCKPGGSYDAMVVKVWSHMLRTAELARRLAAPFGIDDEAAYTLGLLHDVGKLVIFDHISDLRHSLHAEVQMPPAFLTALLGHLHEPVGGLAALRWEMGGAMAHSLSEHHRRPPPDAPDRPTELIYVAERLDLIQARVEQLDWEAIWQEGRITTDRGDVEARFMSARE